MTRHIAYITRDSQKSMMMIEIWARTLPFVIIMASFLLVGCQYDSVPAACYEIEFVGKDNCRGGILVSVISQKQIGETLTYSDGKTYPNVIMVYSEVEPPSFTKGFVQIRDFDKNREIICPPNNNTISKVPTKMAVFWSEEPCRFPA